MSREVTTPKTLADLRYLAERNRLTEDQVAACGGDEGVSALLRGEKIKVNKKLLTSAGSEESEDTEDDTEDDTASAPATKATSTK